jgi:single-strand DNA-binding protein
LQTLCRGIYYVHMFINKVILYGNLTKDPELKALPSGSSVTSFSIATNRTYKDAQGVKQEAVDYHNIVVFGPTAENVAKYMKKGSALFVEGRLQTRSYDKDGQKKYITEVVAEPYGIQFGPKSGSAPASGSYAGSAASKDQSSEDNADEPKHSSKQTGQSGKPASDIAYPTDEINPDDIPF